MTEYQGRVVVFGMGGTIAMSESDAGGVTPSLSARDLVGAVPGLDATGVSVDLVDFRRLPGASLDFATLAELSTAVSDAIGRGATGAVVTQGTDTIEETSFFLDLYHRLDAPLVVTGAMRNPAMAGADGPANLLAAVVTAADASARGRGVLVVLNDEIHAARRVRKTNTISVSAFQSPGVGPVGRFVEGAASWLGPPDSRQVLPSSAPGRVVRVGLHTVVLDDDPTLIRALSGQVDALVVAAMGAGHVPEPLVQPLAEAATVMPVVLASRIGSGPVLRGTYGFAGSELDLIGKGLIPAGTLDPFKARVLLRGLLACDAERAQLRAAFAVAGQYTDGGEWPWPITA